LHIRVIGAIRIPSPAPDPPRTQTGAGTALQNSTGAPAAGFQGRRLLMHGAGDYLDGYWLHGEGVRWQFFVKHQ
jgi:hypothetical protein